MIILGVPDHADRSTIRPTGDWPLSARSQQEHALRDRMVAKARDEFDLLSDRDLRAKVHAELQVELQHLGGDPPLGFPNAFTMPRDELLDFLADRGVGFEPYIEVAYPGAIDPTA